MTRCCSSSEVGMRSSTSTQFTWLLSRRARSAGSNTRPIANTLRTHTCLHTHAHCTHRTHACHACTHGMGHMHCTHVDAHTRQVRCSRTHTSLAECMQPFMSGCHECAKFQSLHLQRTSALLCYSFCRITSHCAALHCTAFYHTAFHQHVCTHVFVCADQHKRRAHSLVFHE